MAAGHTRRIDIGSVGYTDQGGAKRHRYFINEASFGMSAATVHLGDRLAWLRRVGGTLGFYVPALIGLLVHRNPTVTLVIDDGEPRELTVNTVMACNGQFAGGGMWFAPMAALDDGRLDIVILGDLKFRDSIRLTATIYRGKHLEHPRIEALPARVLTARSAVPVRLEADGAATVLHYEVDAQVGGKLAQIGSRLIDATAKKMARDFFAKFAEVVGGPAPEEAVTAAAEAAAPSATAGVPRGPASKSKVSL